MPEVPETPTQAEALSSPAPKRRGDDGEKGGKSGTTPSQRRRDEEEEAEWRLLLDGQMEQLRHRVGAVEEAASSSQADGSARLSEVEGQYGRLKGLVEHQMRNTKETEDALRAHTQLITREVCGWTKRYIDTKLAQQPKAVAGGSSREEGSASSVSGAQ